MGDFINKVIGTILVFTLMVIAPLTIWTFSQDLTAKRSILNETTNFLSKVTDSGVLSPQQVADFYLGTSSYGFVSDVKIVRYMKVTNPSGTGSTVTTYVVSDNINTYNKGDICKVTVKAIDYTGAQKLTQSLLSMFNDRLEYTLAGMVR